MAGKTHSVKFKAHQKIEKPTRVSFKTSEGERIHFTAKKTVEVPVTVSFNAKNKKK
jgi:hypothetical protein